MLIAVGTLAGFVLAEITLWVVGYNTPLVFIADPVLGHFRRPSVEFVYTDEGHARVEINSLGFRDLERDVLKPARTLRIAVLGDSYAEAYQVEMEDAFWKVLEANLGQCSGFKSRIEVLNFGVSGYGTAQELQMLRYRVWSFEPDLILLAFLTGNDVRNNSLTLEPEKRRPFFHLDPAGQLVLDESFRSDPEFIRATSPIWSKVRLFLDHLRVVQVIGSARSTYRQSRQQSTVQSGPGQGLERGLDDHVYLDEAGPEWNEAWKITEALLIRMNMEVRQRGSRFLVVTLSNGIQVHPDAQVTADFVSRLGISNIFLPEERIVEFGRKNGIDVLALAPSMREVALRTGAYLHGFGAQRGAGHWNEQGHRTAGDLIGQYLCNDPGLFAP